MKAAPLFRLKYELDDGAIVEMILWDVRGPSPGVVTSSSTDSTSARAARGSSVMTTSEEKAITATCMAASDLIDSHRPNV
jgi:hypothetical protein